MVFMTLYGAEMMIEIAKFWSSKCTKNSKTGRYEIFGVMGPDEFHEKYPDTDTAGLNNNSYTNVMVVWLLDKAIAVLDLLRPTLRKRELMLLCGITLPELQLWQDISKRMTVIFHKDLVMSQFEGYEQLKELDWDAYRCKYGNIQRLDRILKAEGDSPNNYKLSKQADVCMLFYLLTHEELISTLKKMGYFYSNQLILNTIKYYLPRTSHGSTLSDAVFSYILYPFEPEEAWKLFKKFLMSDLCDTQGGTTSEGIHIVPMAASATMLLCQLCGIDTTRRSAVKFSPHLPKEVKELEFNFLYGQHWNHVKITQNTMEVGVIDQGGYAVPILFGDKLHNLLPGTSFKVDLSKQTRLIAKETIFHVVLCFCIVMVMFVMAKILCDI